MRVTLFSSGKIYLTPSLTDSLVWAEPLVSSIFQSALTVSTTGCPSDRVIFSIGLGSAGTSSADGSATWGSVSVGGGLGRREGEGSTEGTGDSLGMGVGFSDGSAEGRIDGDGEGERSGDGEGVGVGSAEGDGAILSMGEALGTGDSEGATDGSGEGASCARATDGETMGAMAMAKKKGWKIFSDKEANERNATNFLRNRSELNMTTISHYFLGRN